MASRIQEINHYNGNYRKQEKSPSVALRQSRAWWDLQHASRHWGGQGLQEGRRKLTAHFSPQVNATYKVYNFWQAKQKDGETLDKFHTCLRSPANPDKEIKQQIILNCQSNSLWHEALREHLDLAGLMKAGRALELSERQAKEFESPEKIMNQVKPQKKGTSKGQTVLPAKSPWLMQLLSVLKNVGTVVEHILTKTPAPRRTESAAHVAN